MSEPRPSKEGHEDVPDHVLDELRAAFGGTDPIEVPVHRPAEPASFESGEPVDGVAATVPLPAPDDGTPDTGDTGDTGAAGDAGAPTVPLVGHVPDDEADDDEAVATGSWTLTIPDATDAGAGAEAGASVPEIGAPARSTIVIGGDDLPDAVYLDEAGDLRTGDGTARDTIVIGDDLDSSGAFDAVEVPNRSIDPRLRERRIAVKRARGKRRLVWVSAVSAVLVVVVGIVAVFASSLFAVEVVDVQGAVYAADRNGDQLQEVIDAMIGDPVLLVDTLAAERALEQIPWIERAFVYTDFPDRVVIDIRERRPFATFEGSDQRYRVIDRDGRVLDVLDGRPVDYMLISGPGPDLEPGSMSGTPFARVAQMVGALPAELRTITESVSVDPTTGELGLVLVGPAGPVEVRVGTFDALDAKLARLLQQVRDGLEDVERIDVSSDDIVISRTPQV